MDVRSQKGHKASFSFDHLRLKLNLQVKNSSFNLLSLHKPYIFETYFCCIKHVSVYNKQSNTCDADPFLMLTVNDDRNIFVDWDSLINARSVFSLSADSDSFSSKKPRSRSFTNRSIAFFLDFLKKEASLRLWFSFNGGSFSSKRRKERPLSAPSPLI